MKPPILILTALVALSCATPLRADAPASLAGDSSHPGAAHWVRSELYFATGPLVDPDPTLTEGRWRDFLDREVTPRFPDGLTVLDAYGQWRSHGSELPGRLRSKVLVILHEDTPSSAAAIDAIRAAWKTATRSKSVLLVNERVDVSF